MASTPKSHTKSTSKYFPGAKDVGCENDYSHASNAEVKITRIYSSVSLIYLNFVHKENFTVAGNTLVICTQLDKYRIICLQKRKPHNKDVGVTVLTLGKVHN